METKRILDVPELNYLWKVDNLYLAGQPGLSSFSVLKDLGISKVINVRGDGELDFTNQEKVIADLGMDYEHFPIVVDGMLDAKNCRRLSELVKGDGLHFIHCGSANRVGGWLITYLVLYKKMDFESAVEVACQNGLSSPGLIDMAQEIINQG